VLHKCGFKVITMYSLYNVDDVLQKFRGEWHIVPEKEEIV
jgi:hypothetical protein